MLNLCQWLGLLGVFCVSVRILPLFHWGAITHVLKAQSGRGEVEETKWRLFVRQGGGFCMFLNLWCKCNDLDLLTNKFSNLTRYTFFFFFSLPYVYNMDIRSPEEFERWYLHPYIRYTRRLIAHQWKKGDILTYTQHIQQSLVEGDTPTHIPGDFYLCVTVLVWLLASVLFGRT